MPTAKKSAPLPIIAGVLMALQAAQLLPGLSAYDAFSYFSGLAGYAVTALVLITRKRNILGPVGFALIAVFFLREAILIPELTYVVQNLFNLAAFSGMALIALIDCINCGSPCRTLARKLWFIPALCLLVGFVACPIMQVCYYYQSMLQDIHFFDLITLLMMMLPMDTLTEAAALLFTCLWYVHPNTT